MEWEVLLFCNIIAVVIIFSIILYHMVGVKEDPEDSDDD